LSPRRFTGFLIGKRQQERIYCKYRETEMGMEKGVKIMPWFVLGFAAAGGLLLASDR
jgi:hypothetical protein